MPSPLILPHVYAMPAKCSAYLDGLPAYFDEVHPTATPSCNSFPTLNYLEPSDETHSPSQEHHRRPACDRFEIRNRGRHPQSRGLNLVIHHDPFVDGERFDEWINAYRHGTLILNVKEEGLEARLIALMQSKGIDDYFFLDQSFPFLVKWSKAGEHRCAVRVSEFESIDTALSLAGKVDWVWVDCFTHFSLSSDDARQLKQAGFKLCLVSPELQGRDAEIEIPQMASMLKERNIEADAICTKRSDLWEKWLLPMKKLCLHPLFFIGLAIRLLLIVSMAPHAGLNWFAPFLDVSTSTLTLDPWSEWIARGGTPVAFPYGYAMWLAFLPLALVAKLIGFPQLYAYELTLLAADFGLLATLHRLLPNRQRLLLVAYWLFSYRHPCQLWLWD